VDSAQFGAKGLVPCKGTCSSLFIFRIPNIVASNIVLYVSFSPDAETSSDAD
jgi:hypothetical protein